MMKRYILFPILCCLWLFTFTRANAAVVYEGKRGPSVGKGKHIVFLSGDEEYRSEEGLPQLAKILAQRHGFKCTVLFAIDPKDGTINPNVKNNYPGIEAIDSADAIVMLLRFREWPDATMKHFVDAYLAGKPIIALRTSTHAFAYDPQSKSPYAKYSWQSSEWPGGFGKQVLGETWVAHHGHHKHEATRGIIEPSVKKEPIMNAVREIFGDTDVYEAHPPADVKVLVHGQVLSGMSPTNSPVEGKKNDPMQPVAWTRLYRNEAGKTNKIFCTTMGSSTDLQDEFLRRLLVNSVFWATDLKVPPKADVRYIGEYKPTMYGFDGFKKGVKPEHHKMEVAPPEEPEIKGDDLLKPQARPERSALPPSELPLSFINRERIAFVGNSLAANMNLYGHFEALLHSRFPHKELVVRNFGRPADEVGYRQRSNDYTALDDPLFAFGPDTFFCFFGYNESFAGPAGIENFKTNYEKFLDEFIKKYPRDDTGAKPRFVLISPIAFQAKGDLLPDAAAQNRNLKLYAEATAEVAKKYKVALIDLFTPTEALFTKRDAKKFTVNGFDLNEAGDREVAQILDRELFQVSNQAKIGSAKFQKLRAAVNDKSWVHAQDYRMINGWYVYGGRRTFDKETFPREYLKIRAMAEVRDRYIWDIAQGNRVPPQPDDSKTGDLHTPPTRFGMNSYSEPKELRYLTPEESMATMQVPDGFQVNLFASDREFPELAKPVQLNFDNKGRLWVACMPTYPQWKPGDHRPDDRLLIFEDTNGDGKADKCKTFYDKLQCPVGFEFWNGGVLVVDQPRILFLKDTNGDDKADIVEQWTDGWATDDSHHCVNAWEWSPGGLLHMLEGVYMSTTVETPWGAMRNNDSPGAYVIDPRTMKIRHYVTPGYGNPWCYVFNWWGQGIVGDGTTAQQHWDSPLSGAQFGGRRGLETVFDQGGMRPVVGSEFLYTRQFPENVQGQFIYACVINMNGLTRYEIRDDGSGFTGNRLKKTIKDEKGADKQVPNDLLTSSDRNFRPTDPQLAPDGTLYFGDWCNALIGHMQYSQRDPNRDHTRGRIYRLSYKDKPLLKPVTQFGKSISALLDQLKEYEPRTRYRARRELFARPTKEVAVALKKWIAKLDPQEKEYDRLLTEALWIQQSHHVIDNAFLQKVLRARTGEARAAATRVLADQWNEIPNAMELIKAQITDGFSRTRLEAVRALSFVETKESVETILQAANQPMDRWLQYTLEMALGALEPVWRDHLKAGTIATENPTGLEFLHALSLGVAPGKAAEKIVQKLIAAGNNEAERRSASDALLTMKGKPEDGKALFGRVCVACHKVGDQGVDYGPDLTIVANRLSPHDIIESIIAPSAKVDPKYITINLETNEGEALSGFLVHETDELVELRIAGGTTQKVKKSDIRKRESVKQSSMPEGLASGMSATEFLDLVTYLKNLKDPKK